MDLEGNDVGGTALTVSSYGDARGRVREMGGCVDQQAGGRRGGDDLRGGYCAKSGPCFSATQKGTAFNVSVETIEGAPSREPLSGTTVRTERPITHTSVCSFGCENSSLL